MMNVVEVNNCDKKIPHTCNSREGKNPPFFTKVKFVDNNINGIESKARVSHKM